MTSIITGAAGFIGSNLVGALLERGDKVVGLDNLGRGTVGNLARFKENTRFSFECVDVSESEALSAVFGRICKSGPIEEVWHLAANSDIPGGVSDARVDLKDTFLTTFQVLEAMKQFNIPVIAFASSSAIYGDLGEALLTEEIGPLFPVSNYGAMKLASEAIITAAVESYLERAYLFRFPNVVGTPATHGVVYDFINKLRRNPKRLAVLGDGSQQKAYLHVEDLIDAMLFIRENSHLKVNCFNIGNSDEGATVRFIAEETVRVVSEGAAIEYGKGNRGWVGDVPKFRYSTAKLENLGWSPKLSSLEAMRKAIRQIAVQEGL